MFYATRTFAFKMGQSASMLIFTGIVTIGAVNGTGYRIAAGVAAGVCLLGGIVLFGFNEKKFNSSITQVTNNK